MTTNPYWTEDGKAKNLALLTSTERCKMLETLRQTEARDWIRRYRLKAKQLGPQKAQAWWLDVKTSLKKRRGQAGLDTLIAEMERQRDVNRL
ncbi:hypothetical protein UFOVP379_28 [uncultured Caudovirales phage]|uniref:Uncharacterized protein n=1 Tax=uncultured Caudovirales phage TaxID=2100421 RepID=A0A6J7WXG9_9CAUD|nr:hypothetical protein UFOVP379_28 [uncultured Caudovirales phage]